MIGELVARERSPLILDLSLMSKTEMARFVEAFAETLYRRNRSPLHVVLDEADAFAPQRPAPGEQRMLGAINSLVRRGRQRGLGCTLITQRPAVISKDVLTQSEVLICFRLTHPRDRKAVAEWVDQHADGDQRDKFMGALAALPKGTCWIWSPGWLDLFRQVTVRRRRTFDSSATPKVGAKPQRPPLRQLDPGPLRKALGVAVEQAEANDPVKLRARIRELERDAAKPRPVPASAPTRSQPALGQDLERCLSGIRASLGKLVAALSRASTDADAMIAATDVLIALAARAPSANGRHRH